jgi:uncharacterized membrane protein
MASFAITMRKESRPSSAVRRATASPHHQAGVQMQALVETIKAWQLHPVVDHFTVALIIVAILVDLVASIVSTRMWLRYSALTLMILGTAAAWGSYLTGGWEAGRVWENVKGPALDVLKRHAWLGDYLPWVFLVLAVWRLGIQFLSFIAGTRPIYLMLAVVAGGVILYQGSLGGELVYDYGVGTALLPTAAATASPQAEPTVTPAEPSSLPTVFNPAASSTPMVTPSPEASPAGEPPSASVPTSPATVPTPSESPTPAASPSPLTSPLAPGGTPVNPPGVEASPAVSSGTTPAPKNL